jgi:hypothetical protein
MTREERLEAALRSVDFAVALSRAAHDHMHRHGLDCPHDIGIVLAKAARAALDAPPAAEERPSGLYCRGVSGHCLQGCGEHGWCRRDPAPPPSYVQGSPFTRYADGAWWLPAAEQPAARASERGEGRGASTGLLQPPDITCPKCGARGAAFICSTPGCPVNGGAAHPSPYPDPAERGFVGAVYGPAGEWKPTDPTIEANDPA